MNKAEITKALRVERRLRANYRREDGYTFDVFNVPGHVGLNLQYRGHAMSSYAPVKDSVFDIAQHFYEAVDTFSAPFYPEE